MPMRLELEFSVSNYIYYKIYFRSQSPQLSQKLIMNLHMCTSLHVRLENVFIEQHGMHIERNILPEIK